MSKEQKRRLAVIMFSDIVGYTAMMQKDEANTLEKVERYKSVHKRLTHQFDGKILKFLGDGCLTIFESVIEAVSCALEIQKELLKSPKVPIRIGIHIGEVVFSDDDVYGDGINITSRIQNLGTPGSILFSLDVYEKIKNHPEFKAVYLGKRSLKNVIVSLDLYALSNNGLSVPVKEDQQEIASLPIDKDNIKSIFIKSWLRPTLIGLLGLILIILIGYYFINKNISKQKEATVLPELIEELSKIDTDIESTRNWDIYHKANKALRHLRKNDQYNEVYKKITIPITLITDPEGADFYAKPYGKPDTTWQYFGKTPIRNLTFPKGMSRIKITKENYVSQEDIYEHWYPDETYVCDTLNYKLFKPEEIPNEMTFIPGGQVNPFMGGVRGLWTSYVGEYLIDKYEVSNEQYKVFIDSGGYKKPEFWEIPFVQEKDTLSWDEAMLRFIDKTNWSGPKNWTLGDYPKDEGNLPVTGVSWFEALAYSKFAGKSLPTIHHWANVAEIGLTPEIIKFGNFNGKYIKDITTTKDLTRYGTYNLAGNASEWIVNASSDKRYHLGGNYKEPTYWYNLSLTADPWDRSDLIGFRCIKYLDDTLKEELSKNYDKRKRDFSKAEPVSDEVFNVFYDQFKLEKSSIDPVILDSSRTDKWVKHEIKIEVPYTDIPLVIFLYLPLSGEPPYQTIVYMHHGGGWEERNTERIDNQMEYNDFFIKSGRAFAWPILYGMFGRLKSKPSNELEGKHSFICRIMDFQMCINYLETRSDINADKFAYYGVSYGGETSPHLLAVEDRIKTGIIALFGLSYSEENPFADQINYLPRVEIPMLLLGGRYDQWFIYDEMQVPFYNFLGTSDEHKKFIVYESTHFIPRNELINESISWLDKYFGPVDKKVTTEE
jgi:class 3 adenylate cyclase/dienelactone hydrolase